MGVQHHENIKAMEDSKVDLEREIEEEREKERVMLKGESIPYDSWLVFPAERCVPLDRTRGRT
jgi:hypothetical protein